VLILLGYIIVLGSVFGGYASIGGQLGALVQPAEFVMIIGAALGAFVCANNGKAIKATLRSFSKLKRTKRYNKMMYMELMALQYRLLTKARRDGMLAIERDIDSPQDSAIFADYPKILSDPMIMAFLTDYLRLMVSGNMDPFEIDALMEHEIETFQHEAELPAHSLFAVGDGLPAFGIVAAVMGVVHALGSADQGAGYHGPDDCAGVGRDLRWNSVGLRLRDADSASHQSSGGRSDQDVAVHSRHADGESQWSGTAAGGGVRPQGAVHRRQAVIQ